MRFLIYISIILIITSCTNKFTLQKAKYTNNYYFNSISKTGKNSFKPKKLQCLDDKEKLHFDSFKASKKNNIKLKTTTRKDNQIQTDSSTIDNLKTSFQEYPELIVKANKKDAVPSKIKRTNKKANSNSKDSLKELKIGFIAGLITIILYAILLAISIPLGIGTSAALGLLFLTGIIALIIAAVIVR